MTYEEFCKIRGIPYNQETEKPDVKQPEGVPSNPRGRPPKDKTDTDKE